MKVRIILALVSLVFLIPSLAFSQGGWITIPGQAFVCQGLGDKWFNKITFGGQSYFYSYSTGTQGFVAPIVFPPEANGLSVRQMNATVGDDDITGSVEVYLCRMNRFSGMTQSVFWAYSSNWHAPGKIVLTDTTGGYRLIDNQKYAWFIKVNFVDTPSSFNLLRLYSVRIKYQ